MTAYVNQIGMSKWQAYCEEHQDGVNGSKYIAEHWADSHNDAHHPDGDEDGAPQTQEEVTRGALDAEEARLKREDEEWMP